MNLLENQANEDTLKQAMDEAFLRLFKDDGRMTAASSSAGFLGTVGKKSYQVFVKVCEYSDELLQRDPDSGGLLCESKKVCYPAQKESLENEL